MKEILLSLAMIAYLVLSLCSIDAMKSIHYILVAMFFLMILKEQ